jgi:phage tail P2-like protein
MTDLLPPNASPEERALSAATARLSLPDTALGIDTLWNPDECPEALLPWLAWALSVDMWNADWDTATKRRVIAASIGIRRRAGTVWAVKEALKATGYEGALITEGFTKARHDGAIMYNGNDNHSIGGGHWAEFDIKIDLGETVGALPTSTAALLRLLYNAKPASRHLRTIRHVVTITDTVETTEAFHTTAEFEAADVMRYSGLHNGTLRYNNAARHDNDRDRLTVYVLSA